MFLRTLLDADPDRIVGEHLVRAIGEKLLALMSGSGRGFLKKRTRNKKPVYQITAEGLEKLQLCRAWTEDRSSPDAAFRSWGADEEYTGLLLLVDTREMSTHRSHEAVTEAFRREQMMYETCTLPTGLGDYVFVFRTKENGVFKTILLRSFIEYVCAAACTVPGWRLCFDDTLFGRWLISVLFQWSNGAQLCNSEINIIHTFFCILQAQSVGGLRRESERRAV